jgi:hypothetical protein
MTASTTWPTPGNELAGAADECPRGQAQPGQCDHEPAHVVIGEMAGLLRDTRGRALADGCLLGAIAVGFALEAGLSARVRQPGLAGVVNLGLLCGIVCCWLVAVLLLARASRPALGALTGLRSATGAPVDPRPPWVTLPPAGADPARWSWDRAYLLLAAARSAGERMQLADTWTYFTGGCFLAWTAIIILGG